MDDIYTFLKECVYYPCSGVHGTPIKFLSKRFQRFFYADYKIDRNQLIESIGGIKGYQLSEMVDLTSEDVFGMSWIDFEQDHQITISKLTREFSKPFIALSVLERTPGFGSDHGPKKLEILFACSEAIATYKSSLSRRRIVPKCLVHIRSGIALGGNYFDYPQVLSSALLANRGGLPDFMLYDRNGSSSDYGDYLDIVERYTEEQRWGYSDGGCLILAKRARFKRIKKVCVD